MKGTDTLGRRETLCDAFRGGNVCGAPLLNETMEMQGARRTDVTGGCDIYLLVFSCELSIMVNDGGSVGLFHW